MKLALPACLLVAFSVLTAIPAGAELAERRGFWIAFGGGYGSARARCDQCLSDGRVGSFSGTLRMGGTLGRHWLLGWEASGWLENNSSSWLPPGYGEGRTLGTSSLVAFYYPVSSAGFFVKGGFGISYAGLPDSSFCSGDVCVISAGPHGSAFGLNAGLGYDVRIARKLSLTPEVSFAWGSTRDLSSGGGAVVTDWSHDVWAVNLCLTFH